MHKLKALLIFVCLFFLAEKGWSQDSFFSQFYANRLNLNPAWAGIGEEKRLFLNYRNMYPGIGSVFKTYTVSYDQYVEKISGGLGFYLSNDVQGSNAINQISFSAMYSYQIKAGRFLSFSGGIQAGGAYRSLNSSDFRFLDQWDPINQSPTLTGSEGQYPNVSKIFPDFSTGVTGYYRQSYGGISMSHLLKPYQNDNQNPESRLPRKLSLFAGTYIPVYERRLGKEVLQLNPNFIYIQQKNFSQLIYGLESLYKGKYVGGLWLRQNLGIKFSALIFSAGISFDNIRLRYSYDRQFSGPTVQLPRMGSHEISMIITFDQKKKINHKAIKCPKI
jgi:type IX secretion system PorP/SprF family membrane protein